MNWVMLVCKIPDSHKDQIPDSVSIVEENPCWEATNELKVTYNLPVGEKKSFAVCSKGLSIQDDQSLETVEWLEVLRALGADQVFVYTLQDLHPKIIKVSIEICYLLLNLLNHSLNVFFTYSMYSLIRSWSTMKGKVL